MTSQAAQASLRSWPRLEHLLAAGAALAAVALVLVGVGYALTQAGLFLWFGAWLSPVEALALLRPGVLELGWVIAPQSWHGLHVIATSAWFGPIAIGTGLAAAGLARAAAAWSDDRCP
jgi:hypothetical protein